MAQTLVRSVARAFYTDPEERRQILIIDALVFHSTLRDDDLSLLMHLNTKDLHRICNKLREDRLLQVHARSEIREGKEKASSRTYYYIDYRQAIDAIKYRTFMVDKKVQGESTPAQEKKEYFCSVCQAEWTALEVLDNSDPVRGFLCHRCNSLLKFDPDRQAGGHEKSTKLNSQLKFIIEVLPKLDTVTIPEADFEATLAQAIPVVRNATNQVAASVAADTEKPAAVKGLANTGPQSIAISITDTDGPTEAEKEAERLRKEEVANMNALPSWHTTSTVTGLSFAGSAKGAKDAKADGDQLKKSDESAVDATHDEAMDELFKTLQKSQQEEARRKQEEEDDEDEDEDEEESEPEEFVDISANVSSTGEKRFASSGSTSAADTPASEDRPSKRVKVEEPTPNGDSEDEDDMQFEDV